MTDLAASPYPLVFPVREPTGRWRPASRSGGLPLQLRTSARALAGMQKEAVVAGINTPAWRMVCDEGPYLLGTDLAPFPLAFFCVGMVSGFFTELKALAAKAGITGKWQLVQDNRYTMEGSATAGTMRGEALPVELQLASKDAALLAALEPLLQDAVAATPAAALLRQATSGRFSLCHNGHDLPTSLPALSQGIDCRAGDFDGLAPDARIGFPPDVISKIASAKVQQGVSGGVGTSLTNEQKRTLHMQGVCHQRDDGLLEVVVELYSPLGSRFRFLVEPGEDQQSARAPSPAMYLSAGIAFCFLTQMGRYAHIVRKPLGRYEIVQDSAFGLPGVSAATGVAPVVTPLETAVSIDSDFGDDHADMVLRMSEQTCFLHAACRQQVSVRLKAPLLA